jgi:dTMP kinase
VKKTARRGRFYVLEGLDGAGTTTQSHRLTDWLRGQGRRVHLTAEPSPGPVGALARQVLSRRVVGKPGDFDALALALLFAADRLDHVATEIAPKLAEGIDVVSDRYALSSLAYQGLTVHESGRLPGRPDRSAALGWVEEINRFAPAPDLTLFLEIAPARALRRRRSASLDPEIFEVSAFQRKVAGWYGLALERVKAAGQGVVVLDGEQSVDAVFAAVVEQIRAAR